MTTNTNELAVGLDTNQRALLTLIGLPLTAGDKPWPVWDFVAREFERDATASTGTAAAAWGSLPMLEVDGAVRTYGLVWRAESGGDVPRLEERVGLTVAGLDALAGEVPTAASLGSGVVNLIRWLGEESSNLESDPRAVVRPDLPVGKVIDFFDQNESGEAGGVTDDVIFDVLQREYCNVHMNRSAGDGPTVTLTDWLRPFAKVVDLDSYLGRASALARRRRPAAMHRPADLLLVLDYVSFAFSATPGWDVGHLIVIPDLQTAASLGQEAHTESDFKERMSALSAVLKSMSVPKPSKTGVSRGTETAGAINALSIWAEATSSPEAKGEVKAALADIRSAIAIRVNQQHPSSDNRRRAADAHERLGLTFPTVDWSEAWDTIRSRLADAFDLLRRETATRAPS